MSFYQLPVNLSDLDHFRSDPRVQFKEENVGGIDVVIPVYMIADHDFWKRPLALELRGHVFRKDTGELISAALPKFFNIGENEYTQRHVLPMDRVSNVANKFDGSMITFALINDKVYAKTKKSFYSDVAIEAQKFLDGAGSSYISIIKEMLRNGESPVYEFFHPEWKIVLHYGDAPSFAYLGHRSKDGRWVPSEYKSNLIDVDVILDNLDEFQNTATDVEGIVIQFDDGRVVKWKTKWYCQQHSVQTEMRERDIAKLIALEQIDDVKSIVAEAGLDISKIEEIEVNVIGKISAVRSIVETYVKEAKEQYPTVKDAAIGLKSSVPSKYFSMIMRGYRGQEVDYVSYFLDNHLRDFSLKCVYNENF